MALYCVSQGVPFDLAFSLDEETLTAYSIILGEHAGGGRFRLQPVGDDLPGADLMLTFDSMGAMAVHLTKRYEATKATLERGLEKVAVKVQDTAYAKFGTYQPAAGPFAAWVPLADSTKEQREKLGYTPDDPLFREGQLQAGLDHHVEDLQAVIGVFGTEGSNPPDAGQVMIWQEMGTATIPPRPVLGPAAFENKALIERVLGEAVVEAVIGDQAARLAGF